MADRGNETYPLPNDPVLAQAAAAIRDAGHWGWVVDRSWSLVYVTEDQRLTYGAGTLIDLPLGGHFLGHQLRSLGGLTLADVGGD
jgi:hypothetical protein